MKYQPLNSLYLIDLRKKFHNEQLKQMSCLNHFYLFSGEIMNRYSDILGQYNNSITLIMQMAQGG